MERFIKIDYYDIHSSDDYVEGKIKTKSTYVRLDCFLQINELQEREIKKDEWSKVVSRKVKMACVYLSRIEGRGINGVGTTMLITENSYNKLLDALHIFE